jgi:hypothetical protein
LIQQLNSAEPRLRRKFPIGRPIRYRVPRAAPARRAAAAAAARAARGRLLRDVAAIRCYSGYARCAAAAMGHASSRPAALLALSALSTPLQPTKIGRLQEPA